MSSAYKLLRRHPAPYSWPIQMGAAETRNEDQGLPTKLVPGGA
jgi:hypothetical protein